MFQDVTQTAGITPTLVCGSRQKKYILEVNGTGCVWFDYNNDGYVDLYIVQRHVRGLRRRRASGYSGGQRLQPHYFYHNKGDGKFEETGATAGIGYNGQGLEQSNMGLAIGDIDNDGWTDVFVTEFAEDNYTLFHNDAKGVFSDISYPSGVAEATIHYLGWATFFMDYNNDGLKDLFCVNDHVYPEADRVRGSSYRQPPLLFQNLGDRKFKLVSQEAGIAALRLPGRGGAFCDNDNDGDLDVAVINIDDRPTLLRNDGGERAGHWIQVRTVGRARAIAMGWAPQSRWSPAT